MRLRSLLVALALILPLQDWVVPMIGATSTGPLTPTFLEAGTDSTQDFTLFGAANGVGTTGTITSDTSQSHTGPRSVKLAAGATSGGGYLATPAGVVADAGARVSVWFRTTSIVNNSKTVVFQTAAPANCWQVKLDTTGNTLDIDNGNGTTLATGTIALSVNTWTRLSFAYTITNATTFTLKSWVNGFLNATATSNGTLTNVTSTLVAFEQAGTSGAGITTWFDDFYVDKSSSLTDPGAIMVTSKRPVSNGTTNGFTTQIGAGGSGYGTGHSPQVNEQPLSQVNGWSMIGAGSAVTEEYTIEGTTVGDVNISGNTVVGLLGWVFAKTLSNETGQIVVSGASTNINLTNAATAFVKSPGTNTYPAGGTDIGIVTTNALTTVSLYECGMLIAFK